MEEFRYFASQIILIEGVTQPNEEQLQELFDKIDTDKDDNVSFPEMFAYWCECCKEKLELAEKEAKSRGITI